MSLKILLSPKFTIYLKKFIIEKKVLWEFQCLNISYMSDICDYIYELQVDFSVYLTYLITYIIYEWNFFYT
jgi:hypothetical protein